MQELLQVYSECRAASCLQYVNAWLLHCQRVEFSPLLETPERLRGLKKKTSQESFTDVMWWIPSEQQQPRQQQQPKEIIKKKQTANTAVRSRGGGVKLQRLGQIER